MTVSDIHTAFLQFLEPSNLVLQRKRRAAGLSGKMAAWYRFQLKAGKQISLETKIKWLKKAGIDAGTSAIFSKADLLDFLHFSQRQDSQRSAAIMGDEYLLEKFMLWRQQGRPAVIRVN